METQLQKSLLQLQNHSLYSINIEYIHSNLSKIRPVLELQNAVQELAEFFSCIF